MKRTKVGDITILRPESPEDEDELRALAAKGRLDRGPEHRRAKRPVPMTRLKGQRDDRPPR